MKQPLTTCGNLHSEHGHFAWAQLFSVQRESSAAPWQMAIVPSAGTRARAWAWGDADLSAACARRNGALTSQGQPRTASRCHAQVWYYELVVPNLREESSVRRAFGDAGVRGEGD